MLPIKLSKEGSVVSLNTLETLDCEDYSKRDQRLVDSEELTGDCGDSSSSTSVQYKLSKWLYLCTTID